MCRFLAYTGSPVILNDLLFKPEHSLIKQSYAAQEMEEPLNGDGFGVGWYVPELGPTPALFTSIQPAWNNRNLRYLSPKIQSGSIFAHIRSASVGDVTELNCHPFHYKNLLMMHNGGIDNFEEIKRPIIDSLSEERFRWLKGQTDSEHIFALFLDHLFKKDTAQNVQTFLEAFKQTFDDLENIKHQYGLSKPSYLNLIVTNGSVTAGSRYVSGSTEKEPLSLHHSEGAHYSCANGKCTMNTNADDSKKAVLVASEKLTDDEAIWHTVPPNHFIGINEQLDIHFQPV